MIEPLKDFHKDEVRELGRDLGLPDSLVSRHPFPGPGLAIRIICAETAFLIKDWSETNVKLKLLVNFGETVEQVSCHVGPTYECVKGMHSQMWYW